MGWASSLAGRWLGALPPAVVVVLLLMGQGERLELCWLLWPG